MKYQHLQRPEGAAIGAALKRAGLSARRAADLAGLSDARWGQIVSGYQSVGGGQAPVIGPAVTVARMAKVVGVTADDLRKAGREDAAEALTMLRGADAERESRDLSPLRQLVEIRTALDKIIAQLASNEPGQQPGIEMPS